MKVIIVVIELTMQYSGIRKSKSFLITIAVEDIIDVDYLIHHVITVHLINSIKCGSKRLQERLSLFARNMHPVF